MTIATHECDASDDRIVNATMRVASDGRVQGGVSIERVLVEAIRDGFNAGRDRNFPLHILHMRMEYTAARLAGWWKRAPGGFDLANTGIGDIGMLLALIEMKIDKLDEALWDLIKLATYRELTRSDITPTICTYLVYAADRARFDDPSGADCSEIFGHTDGPARWEVAATIERWGRAWTRLLKGSSKTGDINHPVMCPAVIWTEVIASVRVAGTETQEIRVVRVWAGNEGEISFGADGWPVGVTPNTSSGATAVDGAQDSPFPARMSEDWLVANVPGLTDEAYANLIAELRHRGWRDDELEHRVHRRRRG